MNETVLCQSLIETEVNNAYFNFSFGIFKINIITKIRIIWYLYIYIGIRYCK